VQDIAPPEQASTYAAMDAELLRQGPSGVQRYETDVFDAAGRSQRVVFHKANFADHTGAVAGQVGVILDITDLRDAEASITIVHQRLRDAIAAVDDGFAIFDADDRLVECNEKYIDFYGCLGSPEQAIGLTFAEIAAKVHATGLVDLEGEDGDAWIARRIAAHRDPPAIPLIQKLKDGRWLRINERRTADGGAVGVRSDITSLVQREQDLEKARQCAEFLAFHDPLTGLPNRQMLRDQLDLFAARSRRNQTPFAVLFIDLDGFKEVNDTYGHEAGDKVLNAVGHILQGCIREGDLVARLGGDEFVIVAEIGGQRSEIIQIAERVIATCRHPIPECHGFSGVTASLGIAVFPDDASTINDVLRAADRALYQAKHRGKNIFVLHGG
jgi:diguanylate cyclase (GGDEF)-like protein